MHYEAILHGSNSMALHDSILSEILHSDVIA